MSIRPLSAELQQKAENELNEVPSQIQENLAYMREWLAKQPHLNIKIDDQRLLNFLRGSKSSLERTKEKLDVHYTIKSMLPEFYANRDPLLPEIQELLLLGTCLPLPNRFDSAAPRVILFRPGLAGLEKYNVLNIMKAHLMIIDILLNEDDSFVIAGQQVVQDLSAISVGDFRHTTPSLAKKCTTCLQQAYPLRPQGIHWINLPSFFEMMFNVVKPFLDEKIKKRVLVYSDCEYDKLYKVIPQSILPKEYGGEGSTLEELTAEWKKKVESYRNWFLEDEKFSSDESKRSGKPKSYSDLLGIEGSFRKLDVD